MCFVVPFSEHQILTNMICVEIIGFSIKKNSWEMGLWEDEMEEQFGDR